MAKRGISDFCYTIFNNYSQNVVAIIEPGRACAAGIVRHVTITGDGQHPVGADTPVHCAVVEVRARDLILGESGRSEAKRSHYNEHGF